MIRNHGGADQALQMANRFGKEAKEALAPIKSSTYKNSLAGLVDYVLTRVN